MQLLRSELQLLSAWRRDRVAGARGFDLVTLGSFGVPPFEVGVDGSVFCRD